MAVPLVVFVALSLGFGGGYFLSKTFKASDETRGVELKFEKEAPTSIVEYKQIDATPPAAASDPASEAPIADVPSQQVMELSAPKSETTGVRTHDWIITPPPEITKLPLIATAPEMTPAATSTTPLEVGAAPAAPSASVEPPFPTNSAATSLDEPTGKIGQRVIDNKLSTPASPNKAVERRKAANGSYKQRANADRKRRTDNGDDRAPPYDEFFSFFFGKL